MYAGEQFDGDARLYYNRARYLDVNTGRFVGLDPYAGNLSQPVTLNKYAYANSDPVNGVDPSGLWDLQQVNTAVKISAGIFTAAIAIYLNQHRQFLEQLIHALGTSSVATQPQSMVLSQSKAKEREEQAALVLEIARRRNKRVLYYYTSKVDAGLILASQSLKCSPKYSGRLGGGLSYPAGAYATNLEPWNPTYTQKDLADFFYGGNQNRDVGAFVALDGTEFNYVYGSQYQWVRECPAGDFLPVEIFLAGPNLMNP